VRPLAQELLTLGAQVSYIDPYVKQWNVDSEHGEHPGDRMLDQQVDMTKAIANSDIVILLQNHKEFDLEQIAASGKTILDTRGIMSGSNISRL
jgi:UDP-N-acetyl-D-mannosaminuronate dehydrogenase